MYFSVLPVLVRSNLDSDYKNAKAAKQSYSRQHLTGGKFPLEFKLCYLANGKFAKFYFRFILFWGLSMMAYIIETQKSKFANI